MAVELFYMLGDSNYLKLVLLGEVLNAPVPPFSKTEGKLSCDKLHPGNQKCCEIS